MRVVWEAVMVECQCVYFMKMSLEKSGGTSLCWLVFVGNVASRHRIHIYIYIHRVKSVFNRCAISSRSSTPESITLEIAHVAGRLVPLMVFSISTFEDRHAFPRQ